MQGKITRISITYTEDTENGPQYHCYGLNSLTKHVRAERLEAVMDDVTVICEELQAHPRRDRVLGQEEPLPEEGHLR